MVFRAVVTSGVARIGRRNAHLIEFGGNLFVADAILSPLEYGAPDSEFFFVVRQETHVMAGSSNVFTISEPLHKTVVLVDKSTPEAIRGSATCAQALGRHALLHKDNPVTKPWGEPPVFLVFDQSPDEITHLVIF